MHPIHEYIARQIGSRITARKVVVIYDQRCELTPFFDEVAQGQPILGGLASVSFGASKAKMAVYDGSFLRLRAALEGATGGDTVDNLVVYLPGVSRDEKTSLLLETEKAGTFYQQQALRQMARNVLRGRFTDVQIDQKLRSEALTYSDYVRITSDTGTEEDGSLLKGIFGESDTRGLLATWIGDDSRDADIIAKDAVPELRKTVQARLGLDLTSADKLERMRTVVSRFVLANEFRLDINGTEPSALKGLPRPSSKEHEAAVQEIGRRLRERHGAAYPAIADRVEKELGLDVDSVPGTQLGTVDTFRFEERAAAQACFDLIASERSADATALIAARRDSFWLTIDASRTAVWEACRLMIEVGRVAEHVKSTLAQANGKPEQWVARYTDGGSEGWFRLDRAQRQLETLVAGLDEHDLDEAALGKTRALYDETARRMAEGFVKVFEQAGWVVPGALHQTRIWSDVVASQPKPVAVIVVDALRYELGVELAERLERLGEVRLRPAIAALPSITPVGMAALLPGASASFSVVEKGGKLGAAIGGVFLPDLGARQKFLQGQVPGCVDVALNELVSWHKKIKERVTGASFILVRSSEIDSAGENTDSLYARAIMSGAIEYIARALQKLASIGVEHAVITADHGHLFFASEREAAMRIASPGGDTVELHRRCWIGRGGATSEGSRRVSGAKLGYESDLDVVVPASVSVFKAGGDLAYHHGGASLQELVIPVLTVHLKGDRTRKAEKNAVIVKVGFERITNRIFSVEVGLSGTLFAKARMLRPLALDGDRQVALAKMSSVGAIENGIVAVEPGKPVTVGFLLTDDQIASLRIQVLDAETDAILYVSPKDIPLSLGV